MILRNFFLHFWKQYEEIEIRILEKIYQPPKILRKFKRNTRKIVNQAVLSNFFQFRALQLFRNSDTILRKFQNNSETEDSMGSLPTLDTV